MRPARSVAVSLGCLGLLACAAGPKPRAHDAAAAATDDTFRHEPPPGGTARPFLAPVPVTRTLDNGLVLLVVEKRELPIVQAQVVVRGGSSADPKDLPGLGAVVAELMRSGTTTRSSEAIADEVETLGSSLSVGVTEDTTTLAFAALRENFVPVLDVAADVLLHPAFAPAELERVRKQLRTALQEAADDPEHVAWRVFKTITFGAHPYGHLALGTDAALAKVSRDQVSRHYAEAFRPAATAVVLVGDVSVAEAEAWVRERFGTWRGPGGAARPPVAAVSLGPRRVVVDKPGAEQTALTIGHLGVARGHPDFFPLLLMNGVLGGEFNSRINMNLREKNGYTYGASSRFDTWRAPGVFVVESAVRADATGEAVTEVLAEIEAMRARDVSDEELALARSRFTRGLPGQFQTVSSIAGSVARLFVHDLPVDYFRTLAGHLEAVTVADVRRVAEAHLRPEALSIVAVGDVRHVELELRDLARGPVERLDVEGVVVR